MIELTERQQTEKQRLLYSSGLRADWNDSEMVNYDCEEMIP
jgi:hypothetical protein